MNFELLRQKALRENIPLTGQFELTSNCNLNCKMCYIHDPEAAVGKSQLLPASFWIDLARQAVDAGMLILSVTGGETLLYPEIDLLLEELSHMGLLISFNTNGILIDEKRAAGLSKYSLTKINISLYGASNETYERLTGCRDGFTRVSRAINLLQSAGCNVYLNAVLTEENTGDLSDMISYAASRNLLLHSTSYVVPPVRLERAENIHTHRLTPEKAARAEWACKNMIYGESACRHAAVFCAFRNHRAAEKAKTMPRTNMCFSGRSEFSVTWKGELQPCVLFPAIREELLSQRFIDAWKNCVLKMETISYPEKCTTCRHLETCPVCYASVYLETRTHDRPPEYLCRFSEEMLRIWEEESKGMNVRSVDSKDLPPGFFSHGCGG